MAPGGGSSHWKLITEALAGDESALSQLADLLTSYLHPPVARLVRDAGLEGSARQSAEDLEHEVLMDLLEDDWKLLRKWKPDGGLSLRTFVGQIARWRTISRLSSGRYNPYREQTVEDSELERPATEADPERHLMSKEILQRLFQRFRAELSPESWQIFELHVVHGASVKEIMAITGLKKNAVEARISRIRKKARQLADELDPTDDDPAEETMDE